MSAAESCEQACQKESRLSPGGHRLFPPRLYVIPQTPFLSLCSTAHCFLSSRFFQCQLGMTSDKTSLMRKEVPNDKSIFYMLWTRNIKIDSFCFPLQHQMHFNYSICSIRQIVEKKWNHATGSADMLSKWERREKREERRITLFLHNNFLKVWKTCKSSLESLQKI